MGLGFTLFVVLALAIHSGTFMYSLFLVIPDTVT